MFHKKKRDAYFLLAPLTYLAGRIFGSSALSATAIKFDQSYMRGFSSLLQANSVRSEEYSRFLQAARLSALAIRSVDAEMGKLFPSSHSQLLQDVVCALVHNMKRNGFFVEIGVGDGTRYSNSLMLERDFDWSGILAEPATIFHKEIFSTRKAFLEKRAVAGKTGQILRFEQDDHMGELSGLAGLRNPRGLQSLSKYDVNTISFDDLMAERGAPYEIDFVSIDTEGSELEILNSISLDKRRIWFFAIEHNFDVKRIAGYREILEKAGYRQILTHASNFDSWFVHHDIPPFCFPIIER